MVATAASVSGFICVAGCGDEPPPPAKTSTVTTVEYSTVTAAPKNQPDLYCRPPVIDQFEVEWQRQFGPGVPPALGGSDVRPFDYFASYAAKRANVRILKLSPNRIYTRGIDYQVSWMDPNRSIMSNRYIYSSSASPTFAFVPAEPAGGSERDAEYVNGGDTITFERSYNEAWTAQVAGGEQPFTWIELGGIDWWFAEKSVRDTCGQVHN